MIVEGKFWSEEHSLSRLLALLVVYHLLLPVAVEFGIGRLVAALCLSLIAVSGIVTFYDRWIVRVGVRVVAVAAIVTSWWDFVSPGGPAALSSTIMDATLVSFLAAAVVAQVFGPGPVSAHRIRGAIVVYLLIGALFGFLYFIVVSLDPGAIRLVIERDAADTEALRRELGYFSLVTLTTVGYGDITPVSPLARTLATLEAITGQLYIAITLARLVSNQNTTVTRS
jgi:hypothetical protein